MPSPAVPSGAMRQASPPSVSVERKMDRSASRFIRRLGPWVNPLGTHKTDIFRMPNMTPVRAR